MNRIPSAQTLHSLRGRPTAYQSFSLFPKGVLISITSLSLSLVSACDPQTIYRTNQMSLDLNGCIQNEVCEDSLSSRTSLGCYITRDLNNNGNIKRNRFSFGEDQTLVFEDALLSLDVGDRFIGSLFFLEGIESCDGLSPSSRCGDGCLLRIAHDEVTLGNRPTTVRFFTGDRCDVESSDEDLMNLCFPSTEPDMGDMGGTEPLDMGGTESLDMGGTEPLDMGGTEPLDMGACDLNLVGSPCEAEGLGLCQRGVYDCEEDRLVCRSSRPQIENCDSQDNDCDGRVDEELGGETCVVGLGACRTNGVFVCLGGEFSCATPDVPTPTTNDATCDLVDDDCDGRADEDYLPVAARCGLGACEAIGSRICEAGVERLICEPGQAGPENADLCDGIDSDCDGQTDEAHLEQATSCGVGVCAETGVLSCISGMLRNSCTPTTVATGELDSSCNGSDNDCDGRVDEGFALSPTSCGVGVCRSSGQLSCQGGVVIDSCTERAASDPNDLICDGEDGDCDGRVDEGSTAQVSECGIGVCRRFGQSSCVNGAIVDTCQEGDVTRRDDPTCNQLDEDCDGRVDEDFTPIASSCGEGVCRAEGQIICVDGVSVNDCQPRDRQSPDDQSCDGVDQDCDGQPDENYPTAQTNCGIGECASTGVSRCSNGQVIDTCEPITFTGAIEDDCDGLDNDCDTRVDEDFVSSPILCDLTTSCVKTGFSTCINQQVGDTCSVLSTNRDSDQDGVSDACAWVSAPGLPFDILRHEVTFGAYRDCIEYGGCSLNPINYQVDDERNDNGCSYLAETAVSEEPENFPLRCTNQSQLSEYCDWIGGRLPTQSELIDFAIPILGPFDCSDSNGGACQNAPRSAQSVCSRETVPGTFEVCDLSGNLYETTSETFFTANGKNFTVVCLDDYIGSNDYFSTCASQETRKLGIPRIGGRCVRD